jgi:type II secretory pathway pseudopilin PulG
LIAAANRIPNGDVMVRPRAQGFTYLGLIILLAIMALVAAAGLKMGTLLQRAAAEEELLEIGAQFSEALRSYAAATPPGKPSQPPTLQDLLKDPRFPNPRRHLRKIFVDPVTGKAEWGVIWLGDKAGVLGVYSLSDARPLKVANFDIRFLNMENRDKISDWKFLIAGGEGGVGANVVPPNSMIGKAPPPSLFPSAMAGADAGGAGGVTSVGKSGVAQPAGGAKGGETAPPPPPPPVPEASAEEPTPEEAPPAEPAPEDDKSDDDAKPVEPVEPVEPVKPVEPVEPASIVTPPPRRTR